MTEHDRAAAPDAAEKRYSTGALVDPRPTDPQFDDENEAIHRAQRACDIPFAQQPRAVWDNESGEILWIVYEGRLYHDD